MLPCILAIVKNQVRKARHMVSKIEKLYLAAAIATFVFNNLNYQVFKPHNVADVKSNIV